MTLGLYAALGCLGYVITGMGAILPVLRDEQGLTRGDVALYPFGFAAGLVIVGFVGDRVAARLGRVMLPVSLVGLASGASLLAFGPGRLVSGIGAAVLGLGGAGVVHQVPFALRSRHGAAASVSISEANAVASVGSVVAPLLIGAAVGSTVGSGAAFAAVPFLVAVPTAVVLWGRNRVDAAEAGAPVAAGEPAPPLFTAWWRTIVLAVATEFCVLLWAADFLQSDVGLAAGTATTASVGFVIGMTLGRLAATRVLRLAGDDPVRALQASAAVAAAGFAVFWAAPGSLGAVAVVGLVVAGLGVALLYPVAVGEAMAAWPERPSRASGRCALASGLAIGSAPVVLGPLADVVGLRAALLMAPVLLTMLFVQLGRRRRASALGAASMTSDRVEPRETGSDDG